MKNVIKQQGELQAMMAGARATHAYKAEMAVMEITEQIMARMQELGVSKTELANRIGTSPAYVTKILRGETNFTFDTMVKLGSALDCEFRGHLQPKGRDGQWMDFLNEEPAERPAYSTDKYKPVVVIRQSESPAECRTAAYA
jgi:transcriptional regulator with XRE-family HTH domain